MKTLLTLLTFSVMVSVAAETVSIANNYGPTPQASTILNVISAPPTFTGSGGAYAIAPMIRVDRVLGDSSASGTVVRVVTAITGSTSLQSANVSDTGFMTTTPADRWVIEPGTANQEIVFVGTITDATHFSAIIRRNHSTGAPLKKVFSVFSKFCDQLLNGVPTPNGIGNIGFLLQDPLPANVYAQYRLRGSVGAYSYVEEDGLPWISDASNLFDPVPLFDRSLLTATGNPSNGIIIDVGPELGSGGFYRITPSPVIQFIFTSAPEPSYSMGVRFFWDDL